MSGCFRQRRNRNFLRRARSYRKVLHGTMIAGRIGIDKIRSECPHFNTTAQVLQKWRFFF
ncbi:MAG: DUF4276 family protein [bacterium]